VTDRPPAPVAAVSPTQATTVVPVDPAVARQLEATADAFADSVAALDAHSPTFTGKVGSITRMGDREMRDAAAVSTACWSGRSRPWARACSTPARRCRSP
jgi:hypothetical protein